MKKVYTIPSDLCFVTTLAEGLWRRVEGDPLKLAEMTIFLPTRRACRHLRDAFLRVTGAKAALLPRMRPLGDLDEEEIGFTELYDLEGVLPSISLLRRQMLLTKLIAAKDSSLSLDLVASLASALAALLDQVQTEEKSFDELKDIVPKDEDYAKHWQETLQFLEIITKVWPSILEQEACLDPALRRNLVMKALGEAWQKKPPPYPILVAGSTGSVPVVGNLMQVIAGLPQGEVILPGLDLGLDERAWREVDETHPQHTMKSWLEKASLAREDVSLWQGVKSRSPARLRLLREAMRPASVTESWRELSSEDISDEASAGFEKIELDHHREEADVIALRLRAALEEEGKTVALVTPDRALARRVTAQLMRWGIEANDSAGMSLTETPLGSFLNAILIASSPWASPVDYLALLKHPLMLWGKERGDILSLARRAEILVWRGVRPSDGLATAARIAAKEDSEIGAWLEKLAELFAPLTQTWKTTKPIPQHLKEHLALAEKLAASAKQDGNERLWRGDAGEKAAIWLDEWSQACVDFQDINLDDYTRLFAELMSRQTVRPTYGMHPRLSILGPLEARLLQHDLIILGGLNEKIWPPAPAVDPWLSRPMKVKFSLPTPERRIGLSAHDFVSLAAAPHVVLTRARRVGSVPTVPSRFLLQIQVVLESAARLDLGSVLPWREWARQMDGPEKLMPMFPPEPRPPLAVRPKKLSVTEIGTWMRNPYGIYARRILKLNKLEDIDADITAADKGNAIHKALEDFMVETAKVWPAAPLEILLQKGRKAFLLFQDKPQIQAFWWPRFEILSRRFVAQEEARRKAGFKPLYIEVRGEIKISDHFLLSGRVDRIDEMPEGGIEIIDYKTGALPKATFVRAGYEPQLPLLAMLAAEGGFGDGVLHETSCLSYWGVKGGRGEEKEISFRGKEIADLIEKARRGLSNLVETFSYLETPYRAKPKPKFAPDYDDYAHLARFAEWRQITGEDE